MDLRLHGVDVLDPDQRRTWAAARVWTARRAPYLASAILALQPVVVEQPTTRSVDLRALPTDLAWHVYVDPAVLDATPVPELGFWLLHQVTHLLRRHAHRFPGGPPIPPGGPLAGRTAQQRRWNLAGDAEIDDDLLADDLPLPATAATPAGLDLPDAHTAEQYWDRLADRDAPADQVDCGTGCDGQPRPWNGVGAGLSDTGQALLCRDVARHIREHHRTRGDTPAGWQRWADEVLEPTVDWRQVLRAAVRRGVADVAGRVDFTYRRPSRRAAALPEVVLPSLRQPVPTVAVVIDTSGSMSDGLLEQALGEVAGLLSGVAVTRHRVHVLCCDAQVHTAQRVVDVREVRLLGGGGTDMGVGLAVAAGLRPPPDLVVVLTDGYTPWPARPPCRARVIVVLLDPAGHAPDWATAVTVDPAAAGNRR